MPEFLTGIYSKLDLDCDLCAFHGGLTFHRINDFHVEEAASAPELAHRFYLHERGHLFVQRSYLDNEYLKNHRIS